MIEKIENDFVEDWLNPSITHYFENGGFFVINHENKWLFYNISAIFKVISPKISKTLTYFVAICWSIADFSKYIFYTCKWLVIQKHQNSKLLAISSRNIHFFLHMLIFKWTSLKRSFYFIENQLNSRVIFEIWTSPRKFGNLPILRV